MKVMKHMKAFVLLMVRATDIAESAICRTPNPRRIAHCVGRRLAIARCMTVHRTNLGRRVLGCAIEVHTALGPGLLESAYEQCLAHEFAAKGLRFGRQVAVPVSYRGCQLDCGYRIDFVVEDELLVELKTVERVLPIHHAQVLTYLRLLHVHQGFLINFNVRRLVDGVKSFLV